MRQSTALLLSNLMIDFTWNQSVSFLLLYAPGDGISLVKEEITVLAVSLSSSIHLHFQIQARYPSSLTHIVIVRNGYWRRHSYCGKIFSKEFRFSGRWQKNEFFNHLTECSFLKSLSCF